MMNRSRAFTIIELLIALFLSSFIMLGMMQAYRNAISSLEAVRSKMATTRKACLLFNELERDLSSMIVPFLNKEIISDEDRTKKSQASDKKDSEAQGQSSGDQNSDSSKDQPKVDEQQEALKNALLAEVYEDEYRRIGGKKFTLFKSINFITTHPLQVYGDKRIRLVRVVYELVRNKQKSIRDQSCYNLFRKETVDLANFKMKEDEETKQASIRTYLVTDNVKEMYLELITEKIKEEKSKDNKQEFEEVRMFVWGEKDFTVGVVPKSIEMRIVIWDDQLKRTQDFKIFVPVFSYPTIDPKLNVQDIKVPAAQLDKNVDEQPKVGMPVTGVNKTAPGVYNSVRGAQ